MTNWQRTSALQTFRKSSREVHVVSTDLYISELPFSGKLLLQAKGHIDLLRQVVLNITGQELPIKPNTCSLGSDMNSGPALLWLGPEKWLIISDPDKLGEIRQLFKTALTTIPNLLSDVSDARAGFEVSGMQARDLLAKICALDLDARSFGPGQCAQSALVRIPLLLHQVDDRPTFHLYVDRSMARYAWSWLDDAAREFASGETAK